MYMNKAFLKNCLGWGFVLWLIGYLLGIVLFFAVPPALLGWVIMPFGIVVTLWVLLKKIKVTRLADYLNLAFTWTFIAVVCDYIFLVQLFKPKDGYYKLDVYLYYILTFLLPLLVYWWKKRKRLIL